MMRYVAAWLAVMALSSSHLVTTAFTTTTPMAGSRRQPLAFSAVGAPRTPSSHTTTSTTSLSMSSSNASETAAATSIAEIAEQLKGHQQAFDTQIAAVTTVAQAEALRREYLAKKGPIKQVMAYMKSLPKEEKPQLGAVVNQVQEEIEQKVQAVLRDLRRDAILQQMELEKLDVTQPGVTRAADTGRRHPLSMTMEKAVDIFTSLGYDTITEAEFSPEIETDYYCFEALNCPKDHPARDMQDTFYLTEDRELLLRTHTSSVQIRALERLKPPLRIVAPGRVYRKDDIDATHSLMFHQVEILALEKRGELTLGHLKGTVEHFLRNMFGPDIDIRFRGSYFPFTEPSMEVDVFFRGRWMEVLGCGMVDPRVLEMAGIDPNEYSGFAAGFGVERFAMVIHEIADLREFYRNDKRFLQQFPHFHDDGVPSFLSGKARLEKTPDVRSKSIPSKIVTSMEELLELQKAEASSNSSSSSTPKEAKPEKKKKQPTAPSADIDISKLDIRVGVITKAWLHEEADKLFCEEIDVGEDEPRQIASGLRAHYNLEDLEGQRVLVLANLKARKLVGFASHGMVMCAADGEGNVKFVEPPTDAAIGERIFVEGFEGGEPATGNQLDKKKMLEKIFPDLKTNASGVACYQGKPLSTSAGPCLPTLPNAEVA